MWCIKKQQENNLVLAGAITSPYSYSFSVSKGNQTLLAQIEQGLAILKRNGTFQQLHEKWLAGGRKADQQQQALIQFFVITLVIILILGLVLWKWKAEEVREGPTTMP